MIIKVRILADMHVGSIYGLCPKEYMSAQTNPFQKWVLKKWEELVKFEQENPSDYIYLLGDIVDGEAHKDISKLCIPNLQHQIDGAVTLIGPMLSKNTKVIGVDGSRYHDKNVAQTITKILGGTHRITFASLDLRKYGMPGIQFHHKSTRVVQEASRIAVREKRQPNMPQIGMKVSAHQHRYTYIHQNGVKVIHTPCWEYETDFMNFSEGFDIGSIALEIDTVKKRIVVVDDHIFPVPNEVFTFMQGWEGPSEKESRRIATKYRKEKIKETMDWLSKNVPEYKGSRRH